MFIMKNNLKIIVMVVMTTMVAACNSNADKKSPEVNAGNKDSVFNVEADRFDDIQVLRYQVPGFNELSLQQKQLAYYLYQAGLSGRDIYYDQKYRHNLQIRKTLEAVLNTYSGDKNSDNYKKFLVYAKKFFFANGIHHHYAYDKMIPQFDAAYLTELITKSDKNKLPLAGMNLKEYVTYLEPILFDPKVDSKGVDQNPDVD